MSLFRRMVLEEYRLQAELFGGRRFAVFPLFVTAVVAGGVLMLALTGTGLGAIVAGLHGLALFFGLQVGTVGLVGRDAMRDAIGDVTLLVFSARTLPLSWSRLFATFLVKDLAYYGVLFLTPLVAGFGLAVVALAAGVGGSAAPASVAAGYGVSTIALLWGTTLACFALGAATSLTLVGLASRSKLLVLAVAAVAGAGVVLVDLDPIALTPYAIYGDPGPITAALGLAPAVVLSVAGPLLLRPTSGGGVRRRRTDRFRWLHGRLTGANPFATRSLLELARSSGSVWKVAFSLGILVAVTAFLLERVGSATGIEPSAGIAFGTLLGLGSFTTYSWLTQLDDPSEYLRYPVGMASVFAGKRRAFLVVALPAGLAYLALAAVWYPPADLAVGVVIFPLVSVYVFGLTAYLTGLSPNTLLFDTGLFAVFGAALAAPALPLLVAALAVERAPTVAAAVAVGVAAVAALVGILLARRAGPRWQRRLRRQS